MEKKQIKVVASYPDHYEIYEDGSMKAWCKRCNNPEEIPAERAAKIQKIPDWSSSFTCTPCWKKTKEPEKQDTQDRIAYHGSWNLAVALMAPIAATSLEAQLDENLKASIEYWQKYFYQKLINH